jgi:hypothetical protein
MPVLPPTLAPPAPFPLVLNQSCETAFVAPGVRRATYRLSTTSGPLVVRVVVADLAEATLRIDAVLANDTLVSGGETVSSMARRTHAIAGINADYFDIGQTNQPLNVVVRDGALERTPSQRIAFDVRADRTVHFDRFAFAGSVRYGATTLPLTGVNEWPPQGGVTVLTPAYGNARPDPSVTVAALVPLAASHAAMSPAGTYRVASLGAWAVAGSVAETLLGFGPAARALGPLPAIGDTVAIDAGTTPSLDDLRAAAGGGPSLLENGAVVNDPFAPAPEERDRRFPVAGAATFAPRQLALVVVDGRDSAHSVGVTRPEFAALMLGLGASDAMAFDSGGSATLVARVLGDASASVLNVPSDGEERPVADGVFIYSDAPEGPPVQLVARPATIAALPNVDVRVSLALVDAAGHAVALPPSRTMQVVRGRARSGVAIVRAAGFVARIPFAVVPRLARLAIATASRDPDPHSDVRVGATGFDASGRVVALGDAVRFASDGGGRIDATGTLHVDDRDVRIVATAGGARATQLLRVGHHARPLPLFDVAHAAAWRFSSLPSGSGGAMAFDTDGELTLRYDFTATERAAYAQTAIALPGEPQALRVDVFGDDAAGIGVRVALVNGLGERRALTLVRAVDWRGWRTVEVGLPDDVSPPVTLVALYAVDSLANAPTHAAGSLVFRNPLVVLAGSSE